MRRPASRSLHLAILPGGIVEGLIGAPGRDAAPERVAIVLDGSVHGTQPLHPRPGGARGFTHHLPRGTVHAELDVLALPGGESLLGLPYDLGNTYSLRVAGLGSDGVFITGAFSAASFMADEIGVEFLAGNLLMAQAVATRDVGTEEEADGGPTQSWRFRLPVHALLRPHETLTVQPRVAGRLLPGPLLTLSAEAMGVLGCLDRASPHHVEGWAIDLRRPARPVRLDVVVNARVVTTVRAQSSRPDLAGLGSAACGFSVQLPEHPDPSARRRIAVRLSGLRTELAGSPVHVDPVPGLIGSFDTLHGMTAHGWALDRGRPGVPVMVELLGPDGEVVGTGAANQFRGDLLDAGINAGICAFMIDVSAHFDRLVDRDIHARIAGTNQVLPGSPRRVSINPNLRRFLHRRQALRPGVLPRLRRALNHRAGADGISFIMPVHDTPRAWLIEALESVRAQFCDVWELICVDDGSRLPHVAEILAGYAARDPRVRVLRSAQNVGIARAVNFALRAARYDYVAFIDHDDRLEPDAAWQLIRAARLTQADLLYSDEALTGENTDAITELRQRPVFSHDYYLSHPYFVHIVCARTSVARAIGGWDEAMPISADVDFVLRMIEASRVVTHVPAILYRWRTHGTSTGHAKQDQVMAATGGALQRHLDRLGTGARVRPGVWFNQFRVDWPATPGRVLIVIPTKNKADLLRTAITSIERTTSPDDYRLVVIDHASQEAETIAYLAEIAGRHIVMPYDGPFNFSAMNNAAVARHGEGTAFVLFLNNDVEATQDGWIDRMRRLANRRDVGAVGALLMYADRKVQHAGVILGFNKSADHALKFQPVFLDAHGRRNLGYNCTLTSVRDYSAVTAACLMMRRAVFEQVGGFAESFGIGFNDTDLCLRVVAAGLRVLYDGDTLLYHYESATRSQTQQVFHPEDTDRMIETWGAIIDGGDPFYNPNLSLRTQDHVPNEAPTCRIVHPPRPVRLDLSLIKARPEA
jgi:GT2 family glycosyltransferase